MADKKEFNLEDWWEQDLPEVEVFDDHDGVIGSSMSKTTAWGDVGTVGLNTTFPESEMDNILKETFTKFKSSKNTDEWFYIIRRCDTINTNAYVTASEDILYGSKTNTKIKDEYAALPLSEIYFHILRAHTRADENDFEAAQTLWTDIHDNWIHHVNDYRKPFILSALFVSSICTNEWKQSSRYLKKMWTLIKFMDENKRQAFGIWDEWTTCLIVSWFFMKHSMKFRTIFCKDYISQSSPFSFQKKSIILKNLKDSFISDIIPEAYYCKARELNQELPEIQYKEKEIAYLEQK